MCKRHLKGPRELDTAGRGKPGALRRCFGGRCDARSTGAWAVFTRNPWPPSTHLTRGCYCCTHFTNEGAEAERGWESARDWTTQKWERRDSKQSSCSEPWWPLLESNQSSDASCPSRCKLSSAQPAERSSLPGPCDENLWPHTGRVYR